MSADDGIYIANFPNGEMRVAYASDSVIYELDSHYYTPEESKEQIERIFGGSPVYYEYGNADMAYKYALTLDPEDTEYGICEVQFAANFGELREEIAKPEIPENACKFCSTEFTWCYHNSQDCDKNPENPLYIVREALGQFTGINIYPLARAVVEALQEKGKL